MFRFQEIFDSELQELLTECETEEELDEILENSESFMTEFCDESAKSLLDAIKKNALSGGLEDQRQERRGFEERLKELWGEPLDLLELLIGVALEAGSEFNGKNREESAKANDAVFHALTQLHARACQVASAILVLLKFGYADDAAARWRSLHEISVVSSFIFQRGQDLAERYLLHEVIQQYKLAREHRDVEGRINEEPISQEEFEKLETLRNDLVSRFGKSFKGDYGWAASELGVARPTFRTIEKHTDLDHWRPYFMTASDNIHANSHGTTHRLGLYMASEKVLLAGPSNARLADPGHSTAISLCLVTTILLSTRTSLDVIVVLRMLASLLDEVGDTFLRAHHKFEATALKMKNS